jgi:hypothetical protein
MFEGMSKPTLVVATLIGGLHHSGGDAFGGCYAK